MPSFDDIVKIAESLQESPIIFDSSLCIRERHYSSTCDLCAKGCPSHAIDIRNKVKFDAVACSSCGACTLNCPTQAFSPLEHYEKKLYDQAQTSLSHHEEYVVIACERIASKYHIDPESYVSVPCISYIHESLLLKLFAFNSLQAIYLIDGNCNTCKLRSHARFFKTTERELTALQEGMDIDIPLCRSSSFPDDLLKSSAKSGVDNAKRGFFHDTAGKVKKTATKAAEVALTEELKQFMSDHAQPDIVSPSDLNTSIATRMLRIQRHDDALNALYKLKGEKEGVVTSRLFKSIELDSSKCNACNICKVYCPTKAIKIIEKDRLHKTFEFYPCECIGCGLCESACPMKCITEVQSINSKDLFSFEPLSWDITLEY